MLCFAVGLLANRKRGILANRIRWGSLRNDDKQVYRKILE